MRAPLYRQTPPAIFPVALGFMGLGLAWKGAVGVLGMPAWVGDILTGAAVFFFLFFAVFYAVKLALRPAVLVEDMGSPPARAAMGAFAMGFILLSVALASFGVAVGSVFWVGVVLYLGFATLTLRSLLRDPVEARGFTPFQYLSFVGLILGGAVGLPSFPALFWPMVLGSLVLFLVISAGWLLKLARVRPPVPLRASTAIILAPLSLFAMAFARGDVIWAFQIFYWAATIAAIALLLLVKWLTKGGWTPIWGSFVFPAAAFCNMQALATARGLSPIAEVALFLGLAIATPVILFILYKHSFNWITGELAKKSGAATA